MEPETIMVKPIVNSPPGDSDTYFLNVCLQNVFHFLNFVLTASIDGSIAQFKINLRETRNQLYKDLKHFQQHDK